MPKPLLIILAAFILISILYNLAIPPFEGPDGPEHFAYIEWLANGRGFPPQGQAAWATPVRQESGQPPLYYALAAIPAAILDIENPSAVYRPNPNFPSAAPGNTADNKNIAVHYESDVRPLRGGWLALYFARAVSLSFGVLLILAVFGLGRQILPDKPELALLAAALVAFTPQVIFLSSVVSNDIAAAATGTMTLLALARLIRQGPNAKNGLILGAALGLASLAKSSALLLALPAAAAFIWLWLSGQHTFRQLLKSGAWLSLGYLTIAGWWYARGWWVYGSPLGMETHCYAPWAYCQNETQRAAAAAQWREVLDSYWAAFGWGNIKFHGWVYTIIGLLLAAAAAGAIVSWRRRRRQPSAADTKTVSLLLLSGLTLTLLAVSLELWMRQVAAPHGRLLFPAVGAAAILLVSGWHALSPRLPRLAVAGMGLLAVVSLPLLIQPAYARPNLITTATAADGTSLDWRFGHVAVLQNVTPEQRSVHAGDTLSIQLCWLPLARADRDYSVLLHIIGPDNKVIASRRTYPGLGSYPTSDWQPGALFCDSIPLKIPPDLAQTLLYQIEVGLIDQDKEMRLPAYTRQGDLIGQTFAGAVRIEAASQPAIEQPTAGAGPIHLVDHQIDETTWRAGSTYEFTLTWWVSEPIPQNYTTYVHLRDPAGGENVAQADGPPLGGWYPTSNWQSAEVVVDSRAFALPADMAPGRYTLSAGWYLPGSGERLGQEYLLAAIEVVDR